MGNQAQDNLKDLLKEASSAAVDKMVHEVSIVELDEKEIEIQKAIAVVEEGKDKWQIITEKMEGDFAKRFMAEMDKMSGVEFVRTYIKMLEYFKPKIHRAETLDSVKEDNVIRIEIHKAKQAEVETIDITEQQDNG